MKRAFFLVGVFILIQLSVGLLCMLLHGMSAANTQIIASVASSLLMMAFIFYRKYVTLEMFRLKAGSKGAQWLSVPLLVAFSFALNLLVEVLHLPNDTVELQMEMMNSVWGILSIVVLAPVCEEMIFRGAILDGLLRMKRSPRFAILFSSLLFGLAHLNPAQIVFAFALGAVMGWVYYRTSSLLPGMLMHFINNASVVLLYYASGKVDQQLSEEFGSSLQLGLCVCVLLLISFVCYFFMDRHLPKGLAYDDAPES